MVIFIISTVLILLEKRNEPKFQKNYVKKKFFVTQLCLLTTLKCRLKKKCFFNLIKIKNLINYHLTFMQILGV